MKLIFYTLLIISLCSCYINEVQKALTVNDKLPPKVGIARSNNGEHISLFNIVDHNCQITANAPEIAEILNRTQNGEKEIVSWIFYISKMSSLLREALSMSGRNRDFIFVVNYLGQDVYSGVALVRQPEGSVLLWQPYAQLSTRTVNGYPRVQRQVLGPQVSDWIWNQVETTIDWCEGLRVEDFSNYEIYTCSSVSLCLWRVNGMEGVWCVLFGPGGFSELAYLDMMIMESLIAEVYYGKFIFLKRDAGWRELREEVETYREKQRKN